MIIGVGAPIEGQLADPPVGSTNFLDFTVAHEPVMPGGLKVGDYLMIVGVACHPSSGDAMGIASTVEAGWDINGITSASGASGRNYYLLLIGRQAQLDSSDYPTLVVTRSSYAAPTDLTFCGYMIAIRHVDLAIVEGIPYGVYPYGSHFHGIENPSPPSPPTYETSTDNQILFSMAAHLDRTQVPTAVTLGDFSFVGSCDPVLSDAMPHSLAIVKAPSSAATYDGPQWETPSGNLRVGKLAFYDSYTPPPPRQQAILV